MVVPFFLGFGNLIADGCGVDAAFFGVRGGFSPLGLVFVRFGDVNANYNGYFDSAGFSGKLWNLVWKNVKSPNSR